MVMVLQGSWTASSDDRQEAGRPGVIVALRTLATPSNLLLGVAITVGWLALVSWTGVGPEGWQARSCASVELERAACSAVRLHKDQSRLAPHVATAGFAR